MNLRHSVFEYGANLGFVMLGFYMTGEKKFMTPLVGIIVMIIRYSGKVLFEFMEENKAGGTTPYNPLKIPAKKTTP